jgi:predicted ArsR family transcriptional regulator
MLRTIDILSLIEEQKTTKLTELAKQLGVPACRLRELLRGLEEHKLLDYDDRTGTVRIAKWLTQKDREIEEKSPAVGAIILPRYQEITIQDIAIGNYSKQDLELKVRIKPRLKEIAICDLG